LEPVRSPSPADASPTALVEEIRSFEPAPIANVAAPVAEPVLEHRHVPAIASPPAVFEPVVLPSDLELVETSPDKLRIAASNVEPPRPPRVRPPLAPVTEEPLVQIETGK
jgi:ribonuclease E